MNEETSSIELYCKSQEFEEFLHEQLEIIDPMLCRSEEPIHGRPMTAAMFFVENCFVSSDGSPLPEYLEEEWFGHILLITTRWYRARFGDELLAFPPKSTLALILLSGTALQVRIPSVPKKPGKKSGILQLFFARDVLDHENPLDWVIPCPDLEGMRLEVANEFRAHLQKICSLTRRIDWGLTWAGFKTDEHSQLCRSVQGHLEKAITDICAGRRGTGIWEIHLAIEKALKVYLLQRTMSDAPHTHDIIQLLELAQASGLGEVDPNALSQLPCADDAIKHRYSEVREPSLHRMVEIYESAIGVVATVADCLEHHPFVLKHESLYIRALPWHPSRKNPINQT
ncbi:MAG TPA: HEPN domain-containing protein [Planctomycetaceae bacterium]|nr:HEPN domain-containing protein [Planctomycetaceae bacterium]